MSSNSSGVTSTLRVQAVFHELEPHQAERIASEMIARAHELANLPECECDVDVSVESVAPVQPAPVAQVETGIADAPARVTR